MSYTSRVYRHRNAHTHENDCDNEQTSFFKKNDRQSASAKGNKPFFQSKLTVNQPGDPFEREADSVADKVTNSKSGKPVVEEEKITGVQRLATSASEEKLSTDEERMKRDKDIQTKPDIQLKCAECEKEEKEKETVHKMSDPKKEEEREGKPAMQRKEDGATAKTTSPRLGSRITQSAGGGNTMPARTMAEMQSSFGTDFSKVRIHTDAEAADLNKQLNAKAFTHGNDIYFNNGNFNPESTPGKQLLAHELTHVIQQKGYDGEKSNDKAE